MVLTYLYGECRKAQSIMEKLLGGEATDKEKQELEAHLLSCRRCHEKFGRLKGLADRLECALKEAEKTVPTPELPPLLPRREESAFSAVRRALVHSTAVVSLGAGFFLFLAFAVISYVSLVGQREKVRIFRAINQVVRLERRLNQKVQAGKKPASVLEEIKSLKGEDRYDPWGNRFVIKAQKSGLVVYSPGPNGRDENGSGDDITSMSKAPSLGSFRRKAEPLPR